MPGDQLGIEPISYALIASHGTNQGLDAWLLKKNTGHSIHDRVQHTAATISDHRSARRHGLHRNDAEILFSGKYESAASRQIVPQLVVANAPQELNVRLGAFLQGVLAFRRHQ